MNFIFFIVNVFHFAYSDCFNNYFQCLFLRNFIPRKEQPLFDILVGMNGEIMHSKKQPVDEEFFPDFSSSSDLDFEGYNSNNTGAIGRFG